MASISLITMNAPTGVWATILNFFKGANGTYILAVILVAIIVRFLFAFVDIINKRANMKNSQVMEKMQPELDAVQKKYADDKTVLQQKTNDVYKKYQYNMMGSCLPMLVMMVLQLVVFFTLWTGLQSVANYNIASQYQEMKITYANVLALNENEIFTSGTVVFEDTDTLEVLIVEDPDGNKTMTVIKVAEDESTVTLGSVEYTSDISNQKIYQLIDDYAAYEVKITDEEQTSSDALKNEDTQTALQKAIQAAAEEAASEYYFDTQEGFLWIKNVYKSDSNTNPLFTYDEIDDLMDSYYDTEAEEGLEESEKEAYFEETIFYCVVAGIDSDSLGWNGYYILPILAMLSSLFSLWLNNFLTRRKGQNKQQKQSWAMYVIMPLIYGIFTFTYTSLFSIYLIVGQLMMIIMAPITTLIVRKWLEHDSKKQKDKDVIEVDYRRKD